MLRLDLNRLDRERSVLIEASIPPGDPLVGSLDVVLSEPVEVRLRASLAGTGEVVVRGEVTTNILRECRRCLKEVPGAVREDVTMVFLPTGQPGAEDDGEARVFDAAASELDLAVPVSEELILAIDPYVVCDPECRGLCPGCGADLNTDSCTCPKAGPDPRWDALRALQKE